MAIISINWWGMSLQDGVNVLRASFLSARDALQADIARAQEEAMGYQDRVDQGLEESQIEYDEDGTVILDHADLLEWHVYTARDAAMALRKAYVIAAYHHWERTARGWTKSVHGKHQKLVEITLAKGYPISPRLDGLRDLVNVLKHANAKWAKDLMVSWPSAFYPSLKANSMTDWYEAVRLSDEDVLDVLDAVAGSGPSAASPRQD